MTRAISLTLVSLTTFSSRCESIAMRLSLSSNVTIVGTLSLVMTDIDLMVTDLVVELLALNFSRCQCSMHCA